MDEALARRIGRLEDREAIRDLCSRYSLAVDDHDFEALAGLFAPDSLYGWVDQPPQAEGRDAVVGLLRGRIAPAGPSFHVNHDIIVDLDDHDRDRAAGIVFCHAELCPAGKHLIGAIRYRDRYVRHGGRWTFGERFLSFLYLTPVEEYPGILAENERLRTVNPPRPGHWPAFPDRPLDSLAWTLIGQVMDMRETKAGRTGYRKIATALIEEIHQGVWAVGQKLPTEQALVERFGVSRNTVREALRELQDFRYLSKRRGTRSEVIRSAPDTSFLNSIRSVDDLLDYVHAAHGTLLSTDHVILLDDQAGRLGAAPGSEWVRLQLLRRRDPAAPPFCYSEAYLAPQFADILDVLGPSFDVHRAVEARYGITVGRVIQEIEAIAATDGVALKLQVPTGSPILLARTTFHSTQGDIVEIGLAHFAPGRYKMKIALDRRRPGAQGTGAD